MRETVVHGQDGRKCTAVVAAIGGCAFEDILDGYFPVHESVRQLMVRQCFTAMWITVRHAPVMKISALPSTAPVPLFLPETHSGMIDRVVLSVEKSADDIAMTGWGAWFWADGREDVGVFPPLARLGEPAFVQGIGIFNANAVERTHRTSVGLARIDHAPFDLSVGDLARQLDWCDARAWRLSDAGEAGVVTAQSGPEPIGANASTALSLCPALPASQRWKDWDYVLIDLSPDQANLKSFKVAQRL